MQVQPTNNIHQPASGLTITSTQIVEALIGAETVSMPGLGRRGVKLPWLPSAADLEPVTVAKAVRRDRSIRWIATAAGCLLLVLSAGAAGYIGQHLAQRPFANAAAQTPAPAVAAAVERAGQ